MDKKNNYISTNQLMRLYLTIQILRTAGDFFMLIVRTEQMGLFYGFGIINDK